MGLAQNFMPGYGKNLSQNKFEGIVEAKIKLPYYSVLPYELQLVKAYCVPEAFIVDSHP